MSVEPAQPEGTLASQDKGRCFRIQQAQTGPVQGREGLTPHRDVAVGTQLQAGEAGEAEGRCQPRAVCSPTGAWMGLEASVQLPQCCHSNQQHSHTRGMTVSILHPSNIFQKLSGDQKNIAGGHGHLEPNSVRESWMRKGLQKHLPSTV